MVLPAGLEPQQGGRDRDRRRRLRRAHRRRARRPRHQGEAALRAHRAGRGEEGLREGTHPGRHHRRAGPPRRAERVRRAPHRDLLRRPRQGRRGDLRGGARHPRRRRLRLDHGPQLLPAEEARGAEVPRHGDEDLLRGDAVALSLHNTLSGRIEPFEPLEPGKVGVYVCGVTVYDRCHVGHARVFVAFDVLHRWLRARGYQVTFVRNITDVDDRMIERARAEGVSVAALAERNIAEFRRDVAALGCLAPAREPRATEWIEAMIELIRRLEDKRLAYAVGGDVYYAVRGFPDYGKLSKRRLEDMIAGARVEVDERKRDPMDFALWKSVSAASEAAGEPAWPSPWGRGRPGWHIECSAMSTALLGQPFDLHCGGEDLIFPHHENEIAQSEGAAGKPFARGFLHNSFVRINEEKMSKSLGNVFAIRDIAERLPAEALRLFLISTHYRSPMDFSLEAVAESFRALVRLYETLARADARGARGPQAAPAPLPPTPRLEPLVAALDDDLNTARAVAVLFDLVRELNRALDAGDVAAAAALRRDVSAAAAVLGVGERRSEEFLDAERRRALAAAGLAAGEVARCIAERAAARSAKDWKRADELRRGLAAAGIVLEDGAAGTTWRPASWGAEAPARPGPRA
ncbi:MAG: cysteine--tRNA ligase [Deltaproteobacteria bacterium]|nr:cysteine--tRNA ligase [Deltaproteobacteria bacterium]